MWKLSHLDTRFYRQVNQIGGGRVFMYLLSFYLIWSLLRTAIFVQRTLPQWEAAGLQTWEAVRDQWPEEAQVQYTDGQLALAGRDELTLAFPENVARDYNLPRYLAVVQPQLSEESDQRQDQLDALPSLLIFDSHSLWIKRATGNFESLPLSEVWTVNNFTLTRSVLVDNSSLVQGFLRETAVVLVPATFLWFWLIRLSLRLLLLVMMTWLAQPILWLFGWFSSYRTSFRVGLFLLPIAEELSLLLTLFYPDHTLFSFWFLWLSALIVVGWSNRRPMVIRMG